MFVGRFWMIIQRWRSQAPLAAKEDRAASAGKFPTTGGLFIGLVTGVVRSSRLTFFPALALGPIVEQLAMRANICSDRYIPELLS